MNCALNGEVTGYLATGSLLAKGKLFLYSVYSWSRNFRNFGVGGVEQVKKRPSLLLSHTLQVFF